MLVSACQKLAELGFELKLEPARRAATRISVPIIKLAIACIYTNETSELEWRCSRDRTKKDENKLDSSCCSKSAPAHPIGFAHWTSSPGKGKAVKLNNSSTRTNESKDEIGQV